MKRNLAVIVALFLFIPGMQGQSFSGDLESYLNSLVDILPGKTGDQFSPPGPGDLDTWEQMIMSVLSGDLDSAREKAGMLNYKVTDFEDNTSVPSTWYYVVEEKTPQSNFWGTYIFNRAPLRPGLVIQAPHTVYDLNTGYQAIFCFKRLGAMALFFSGTHRCNSSIHTSCSGTTTVCTGSSEPYRISDNAHNTNSAFQIGTRVLFDEVEDTTVFVQLHGFSMLSGDPYLIMSNGTRITPETDYISILKNELLTEDNQLTSRVIHMDLDWNRLTAFTNTQGRYINGSSDPCSENATACNGRFIHIEQERTRLRADSTGWYKMFMALKRTFPAGTESSGADSPGLSCSIRIYPNPAIDRMHIEADGPFSYSLFSVSGQCILESFSENRSTEVDLAVVAPGIYMVRVRDPGGIRWGKVVVQ